MIQIFRQSQKEENKTSFNFPDDDPQAELLKLLAKTGTFGFELISEQFKSKNMKIVRFQAEQTEDYDNIDYGW